MSSVAGPACLRPLLAGANVAADPDNKTDFAPPEWMDPALVDAGQRFARQNLAALSFADMLSLIVLLASPEGRKPLVFTNRSSTVYTAFKRYLSTATRVLSWYEEDLFDPSSKAGRNLQAVRRMHRAVRDKMKNCDPCVVQERSTLESTMSCPLAPRLCADLTGVEEPLKECEEKVWVNQVDMAFTQFGFIGLMVLYPKKLGAINATEEELEGLVHLWAVIGHLLGIQDEFNLCLGGLDLCVQKCRAMVDAWVVPYLGRIDAEWEHMTRCIIEGLRMVAPEMTYEASLMYLCWVLDVKTPSLSASISFQHHLRFKGMRLVLTKIIRMPGQRQFGCWLIRRRVCKANAASEKWLTRAKTRAEAYPSTIKIRQ